MKLKNTKAEPRVFLTLLVACGASMIWAGQSLAQANGQPEYAPLWYEGMQVSGLDKPNDPAVSHIPNDLPAQVLQPFYFIITPGAGRVQDPVISAIPGDVDYTGWWRWSALLDFSGRDLASDPYTSVAEIRAALCTIPGFPGNVGTCMVNGTPLIDITGVGGQTDFVFNIPVVAMPPDPLICR